MLIKTLPALTSAATLAVLSAWPVSSSGASSDPAADCEEEPSTYSVAEATDLSEEGCVLTGDVVIADGADAGLTVPPPGEGTGIHMLSPEGEGSFAIEVDADGAIYVLVDNFHAGPVQSVPGDAQVGSWPADPQEVVLASPSACDDPYYNTPETKWYQGTFYRFNEVDDQPTEISNEKEKLERAHTSIENGIGCGLSDQVGLSIYRFGDTRRRADMAIEDGDTVCTRRDTFSVIDFGDLAGNGNPPLASVCTGWTTGHDGPDKILESDMRFNTTDFTWTNGPDDPSCANAFDLQAVATHEFGHWVGLDHAPESTHGNLTMSENIGSCDKTARTLGRGDIYALRYLY